MQTVAPRLYDYVDYRTYLRDYYQWNKSTNPAFSLRYFASRAGMRSYNYLKFVIDGKRRLTPTFTGQFARALKLEERERTYFEKLVAFTDAEAPAQKEALFREMASLRAPATIQENLEAKELFETWEHLPLLELSETRGFSEDPVWIARRLGVTPLRAQRSLEFLIQTKLLTRRGGRLRKSHRLNSTKDDVSRDAVKTFHSKNLQLAAMKVFEQAPEEREYGSITFALSDTKFRALKAKLRDFRNEVARFLDEPDEEPAVAVYHFGQQLFRISSREEP